MEKADEEYLIHDIAQAREDAEAKGFEVVGGDPLLLLLDMDSAESLKQFGKLSAKASEMFGATVHQTWFSKSGNVHIVMALKEPLAAAERVALQACLGSDHLRELLAVARLAAGIEEPSMLFKPEHAQDARIKL